MLASRPRQHIVDPAFDLVPHLRAKRFVVSSALYEEQTLRAGQYREYTAGMVGWGIGVSCPVDEQHRHPNLGCRRKRTDRIDVEATLLFGETKCPLDECGGEEDRCTLGGNGAKVSEGLYCYQRCHPRIGCGLLQGNGGSQGCPQQDDGARAYRVQDTAEIALLEEPVCAEAAVRPPWARLSYATTSRPRFVNRSTAPVALAQLSATP